MNALLRSILTTGNGFLWPIKFDGGYPSQGILVAPELVTFTENYLHKLPGPEHRPREVYLNGRKTETPKPLLHFAANPRAGYMSGKPPLEWSSTAVQTALVLREFVYGFVRDGVKINYVLTAAQAATQEELENLHALLKAAKGNYNGDNTLVLPEDYKFNMLGMKLVDAEFQKLLNESDKQILRAYGVPSHLLSVDVQQSKSYANIRDDIRMFVEQTLAKWISLLEDTFQYWLPDGVSIRFDTDSLTKANLKERVDTYAVMINSGIISPQEARDKEGIPGSVPEKPSMGGYPMEEQVVEEDEEDDD